MKKKNKYKLTLGLLFICLLFFLYLTTITAYFTITDIEIPIHYKLDSDNVYFYKNIDDINEIKKVNVYNLAMLLASYTSFIFIFMECIKYTKKIKDEQKNI